MITQREEVFGREDSSSEVVVLGPSRRIGTFASRVSHLKYGGVT